MKKIVQGSALLLVLILLVGVFAACGGNTTTTAIPGGTAPTGTTEGSASPPPTGEWIDYVPQLTLDESSPTAKVEATVKTFVDGDTTHFNVSTSVMKDGVLKARYMAVNTPESTGDIEPWGKKASNFTKEKLSNAARILVESETATWDPDNTGARYMAWIWYKETEDAPWRNLNLELLQNGLGLASNTTNNQYGEICAKALAQARTNKLVVFSDDLDPDFPYGEAKEVTLKQLRTHIEDYNNKKVAFEGVITKNSNNTAYVEEYDAENDIYFGMTVYYGYNLSGEGLAILKVGNRVRIVGTVQYYEAGGTYQVSGLSYRAIRPDDPDNIQKLGEGFDPAFPEIAPSRFVGRETIVVDEESREFDFAALSLNASISMKGLVVKDIYTTTNPASSSVGAMTLTCEKDGVTISVRTEVLLDADGHLITAEAFEGKTIDVKGIVDYYDGSYQIRIFSIKDIVVAD